MALQGQQRLRRSPEELTKECTRIVSSTIRAWLGSECITYFYARGMMQIPAAELQVEYFEVS